MSSISMNRCKTKIAYMIWSAILIQKNVPIGPTHCSVIKIINHGSAVMFTIFPQLVILTIKPFNTTFSKQKFFVRISFFYFSTLSVVINIECFQVFIFFIYISITFII